MSEMKPCPFCGSEAITTTFIDPDDFEYMPIEVNDCDAEVTCENERCINGWYLSPKAWNNRPIEDALNARIAELEAAQTRWVMVSERLPKESGWYLAGLIGWAGGSYTGEVHFDAETGLPWRSSVRDEVYCWLDGVPELPKPPEVQE